MFCELVNKDVELTPIVPVKDGRGSIVKTYHKCSECTVIVGGMQINKSCEKMRDKKCLLHLYNK